MASLVNINIFVAPYSSGCFMGIVDGNYRVGIYIHLLHLTRSNKCEKCNFRSLEESKLRPCDSGAAL